MAQQSRAATPLRYADKIAAFVARFEFLCLTVLLLSYALATRHFGFSKPLWFDEVGTLTVSTQPTLHQMLVAAGPDGQPPLHYLAVRGILHLFPYSEFVLRLPALLSMLLAMGALYLFLRRYCPAIVAFLAVACFLTPEIMWYGAEARPYSLMVGFTALLLLCWQSAAEGRRRWLWLIGVALATACLILSQPYGCFYVGPVLLAEAYRTRLRRRLDWGILIALALGLTSIAVTLWSAHATRVALFTGLPKAGIPFARPRKFDAIHALEHELIGPGFTLLCIALLALPAGLRSPRTSNGFDEKTILYRSSLVAIGALLLMSPVIWIFASLTTHYWFDRYVLASTIGVTAALAFLVNRMQQRNILAAGFLVAILIPWYSHVFHKEGPPEVIDPLLLSAPAAPLPIVYGDALDYPVVWHYAAPALRARLLALRDRQRMMSGSIDWMPDITIDAQADRGTYPMPVKPFNTFVAGTPQFLFYSSGKYPDRNWALVALRAEGKHIDQVATGEFNGVLTHLYLVH